MIGNPRGNSFSGSSDSGEQDIGVFHDAQPPFGIAADYIAATWLIDGSSDRSI
jgi:hypothetical protein